MKAEINGEYVEVKTVENLGYQGGRYVKEVKYEGKLYIVVAHSARGYYKTQTIQDKLRPATFVTGQ